jgi:DNA polymerase-3 subunit epsilon
LNTASNLTLAVAFKFIQDYIEMLEIRVAALEAGKVKSVVTLPPVTPPKPVGVELAPELIDMSLEAFKSMVKRGGFVVLDTETTGLTDGEICQIAIINDSGAILLNSYVKTVKPIPAEAQRIHGITDEMVASAPGWAAIAPRVKEILSGKDVIIYNAVYDRRKMMHKSAEHAGMEKIEWKDFARFWCAMEAYAEYNGDWNDYHQSYRWQKLTDAVRQQRVTVDAKAHDALGDCLMTLSVIKKMSEV